ncbi:MAG TPA: hypothetical protein VES20_25745 [Bryobacteraceae bacterium]|nr:hypothetical protein [Bryobacteraceae bacterium]
MHRVAVVPLENLTADPALNWIGRAVSAIVAAQVGADKRVQVFEAAEFASAQSRLATRTLSAMIVGTVGRFEVRGTLRDELAHQTIEQWNHSGTDVLELAAAAARTIGLSPKPYTTSNRDAIKAYFNAVESGDREAALRRASTIDPGYGAPLVALAEHYLSSGRVPEVPALLEASDRARLTDLEKARISFVRAQLTGDARDRLKALSSLVDLQPGDIQLARGLVEASMNAGDFRLALGACDTLLQLDPESEVALNSAGYAHTFLGDLPAARAAFDRYRQRTPKSANAIDSYAEALFYHRQYAEAAPLFLEAHKMNAAQLNGMEPVRAAISYFLAGNRTEADRVFAAWAEERKAKADPHADLRRALWKRWTTGQAGSVSGPVGQAMASLWALQDGDRNRAMALAREARAQASGGPGAALVGVSALLSQPSAPTEVWEKRIVSALSDPRAVRARAALLGWALLLDGKPADAAKVLQQVYNSTPALHNNEERILLAAALRASGDMSRVRQVMPHGFFPPQSIDPGLTALLFPLAFSLGR